MRWLGLMLALVATACPSGDDAGTANDTTSAPPTSGADSTTATTADDIAGTGTSASTSTGTVASCEDARTEAECDALSAEIHQCDWLLTHHYTVGPDGTCEDMNMAGGRCMLVEEASGCGDPTSQTCADSFATVFYDSATVGGPSVEILVAPNGVCVGGLPGWEICDFDTSDGNDSGTGTTGGEATSGGPEPAWNPPECRCGCP